MKDCTISDREKDILYRASKCLEEEESPHCLDEPKEELKMVGRGVNRYVFEIDDNCVGKVETRQSSQNRREIELHEDSSGDLEEWLTPIEEYSNDHRWLVMPKVEIVEERGKRMRLQEEERFRSALEDTEYGCHDIRPSNFGRRDGEWEFFDYGACGKDILTMF